jgi:hypothetical protein
MHIVATVLFALAGIVGLTSALALLTFWYRFPSWLDDLSKYETPLKVAADLSAPGAYSRLVPTLRSSLSSGLHYSTH